MTIMKRLGQELHPSRLIPSLTAGIVSGALLVIFAVSRAAFIFSGDLSGYVPIGIGLALWTVISVNLVVALLSSVKGVVASPQDAPAVIAAVVRHQFSGANYLSKVVRPLHQTRLLQTG